MQLRNLGSTGLRVSVVGIGCNNFGMRIGESETAEVVSVALDRGINFFDTADVYGGRGKSEEFLGKALAGRRDEVVIATKFGSPMADGELTRGASRRYICQAVEASLRRLNTDYIDLYQLHVPDAATPVDETLSALDCLVRDGKVRYLGNSNFSGWQIADAHWTASEGGYQRFATAQNLYSLLDRRIEKEVIPACKKFGLGLLPYFPLASGLLTGKYRRGEAPAAGTRMQAWGERGTQALSDENFDRVDALTAFAEERGHSLLELAISWLVSQPHISSVIAGATSTEQVQANADACSWLLSSEEMLAVAELSRR